MPSMTARLAEWILATPGVPRVAIDGPDTAGKTTLADHLAELLEGSGRPVVRASVDGFHRPKTDRYARGEDSPEGYYRGSFDLPALRAALLDRFAPGVERRFRVAVFDYVADVPVQVPDRAAPSDAVLLVDGLFLLRPELVDVWELSVFLDVADEEILRRALVRDTALPGPTIQDRYSKRYLPARHIYRREGEPEKRADVVVDNTDPAHPVLRKAPWL